MNATVLTSPASLTPQTAFQFVPRPLADQPLALTMQQACLLRKEPLVCQPPIMQQACLLRKEPLVCQLRITQQACLLRKEPLVCQLRITQQACLLRKKPLERQPLA